jgi:hypothetical protein
MPESFLREVAVFTLVLVFAGFLSRGIEHIVTRLAKRWKSVGFELTSDGKVVFKHEIQLQHNRDTSIPGNRDN